MSEQPDIDPTKVRFNEGYRNKEASWGVWEIPGLRACLPRDPAARFSILEIGCGYGHSSGAVKRWFPHARVVAADIIDVCLERVRATYPGVETLLLDADGPFPMADASLDFVYSSNLFEHLHDDASHLAEIHRILRPGGTYVISTPNLVMDVLYSGLLMGRGGSRLGDAWARLTRDPRIGHCNLQTVGSLHRRLARAGFTPELRPRGSLSSMERRKLEGLMKVLPAAARGRAVDLADRLWNRLPAGMGPSLLVTGRKQPG